MRSVGGATPCAEYTSAGASRSVVRLVKLLSVLVSAATVISVQIRAFCIRSQRSIGTGHDLCSRVGRHRLALNRLLAIPGPSGRCCVHNPNKLRSQQVCFMPKEMDQSAFEIDDPPSVGTMPTAPADGNGNVHSNGYTLGNTLYNDAEAPRGEVQMRSATISQTTADQLRNSSQTVLRSGVPHYDISSGDAPTVAQREPSDWCDQPPGSVAYAMSTPIPCATDSRALGIGPSKHWFDHTFTDVLYPRGSSSGAAWPTSTVHIMDPMNLGSTNFEYPQFMQSTRANSLLGSCDIGNCGVPVYTSISQPIGSQEQSTAMLHPRLTTMNNCGLQETGAGVHRGQSTSPTSTTGAYGTGLPVGLQLPSSLNSRNAASSGHNDYSQSNYMQRGPCADSMELQEAMLQGDARGLQMELEESGGKLGAANSPMTTQPHGSGFTNYEQKQWGSDEYGIVSNGKQ